MMNAAQPIRDGGRLVALCAAAIALALLPGPLAAQTTQATQPVQVTTRDAAGAEVRIPQGDKPALMLFARSDQEQSRTAVEGIKAALKDLPPVQVVVVISGPVDASASAKLTEGLSATIVNDPSFAVVGQLQVRVWPTTIVVLPDGKEVARIRGLPQVYARDVSAYLAFATNKIDRQALERRLAAPEIVGDSPEQAAGRHLQVATRLLEKGLIEQARQELEQGLKLNPQNQRIELALARVQLLLDRPREALALLEKYNEKSPLAGEVGTLKGWAMVMMKRWDDALPLLQDAAKLNPNPSEAHFLIGVARQAKGQYVEAAAEFRAAFESSPAGKNIIAPPGPPTATRPS